MSAKTAKTPSVTVVTLNDLGRMTSVRSYLGNEGARCAREIEALRAAGRTLRVSFTEGIIDGTGLTPEARTAIETAAKEHTP